ncbi:hypothetical protein KIH41_11265 [Litoribacter ruber]|uniref:hypothetical protein n=1 Tax=Litoribacter ruber TaxID=702568 RepID=UPI001BD96DEF|nr:hypothetical protein [Litoribacter ruber]MBT0811856.1 hypothetical protein [Litoribacter ruber]
MARVIFPIFFAIIVSLPAISQGRLAIGFDVANRKELRNYIDPQGYLHNRYTPLFALGGVLNYRISDRWEIESGIYETSFHETISYYYKEPGYRPLNATGWQVNGLRTLQIPLRAVYDLNLGFKRLSFNVVGGVSLYNLTSNINRWGETGLSPIPVYPRPPVNLDLYYQSYPLRKRSLAFEGGVELRYQLSNRMDLIYRYTRLVGTREMNKMIGYYSIDNPPTQYEFEVTSKGSAIHNTFSLRYNFGKNSKNIPKYEKFED